MSAETVEQQPEHIPDDHKVSRAYLQHPDVTPAPETHFPFQYDRRRDERAESVYWRKYAPTDADVHSRGCALQAILRPKSGVAYVGLRSADVSQIRAIATQRGYSFDVVHFEQFGDKAHAHIAIRSPVGKKAQKVHETDRMELVALLIKVLAGYQSHSCPET